MKEKLSKGKIYCLISAVLIFSAYIVQRIVVIVSDPTKTSLLVQAFIFTAFTAVVYFLVSKSNEPFYGILTALFGIRMLPPEISQLAQFSVEAEMLYYLVSRVALVIFVIAIIKLYSQQDKDNRITIIPIICAIAIVPFFNDISSTLSDYALHAFGGSMIYSYFIGFAAYSFAMICMLLVAMRSNLQGRKLICDFQIVALAMNTGRRICAVVITLASANHISKSYYCYIAIYVVFLAAFYMLRRKSKK